jgi:hypothetical protein
LTTENNFTAEDREWIIEFIEVLKQKGLKQMEKEWTEILKQIEG